MYLIYNIKGKEWAYKKISTTSWKDRSCNTGNSVLLINACSFSVGHCIVCPSSNSGSDYPFGIFKLVSLHLFVIYEIIICLMQIHDYSAILCTFLISCHTSMNTLQ